MGVVSAMVWLQQPRCPCIGLAQPIEAEIYKFDADWQ